MLELKQSSLLEGLGKVKSFFNRNSVIEEDGIINISGSFASKGIMRKLLGSDSKINALFTSYTWFGCKFRTFFKFEVIKILENIVNKNYMYDVNKKYAQELLDILRPNLDEIEIKDIDRVHIEKTFDFKILPHQEDVIRKYLEYKHVIGYRGMLLHGGVGVGKTATSLFIMEGIREVENIIIICPLPTVMDVWDKTLSGQPGTGMRESQSRWIVKNGRSYNGEKYIVCHYEALEKVLEVVNKLPSGKTGIIIDESHNLADNKSKRTQLSLELTNKVNTDNLLLLSGTPVKAGFRELSTVFKFLDPHFDKATEERYLKLYKSPTLWLSDVLRERYNGYVSVVKKDVIKLEPITTINLKLELSEEKIKPFYLSTIRENLKEYVKKRTEELKNQMDYWIDTYLNLRDKGLSNNRTINQDLVKQYMKNVEIIRRSNPFDYAKIADIITSVNKFEKEQIISHLSGEDKKLFNEAKTIYKYPILKVQGEALANIVGKARIDCHAMMARELNYPSIIDAADKKTIFFSNYIDVCNVVMDKAKEAKYNPIGVYGDSVKDLAKNVDKFTNDEDTNPLVTTYKSLSTGVPLIAADTIVCIDMPFRMYIYEQAIGRAWRLGQDKQVKVFILELDTNEPTINSRNIDIITFFKEEVEKITGVPSSVELSNDNNEISIESLYHQNTNDIPMYNNDEYVISTEAYVSKTKDPKRKAVEELILKYISKIVTGEENVKLYSDMFSKMSDKQFEEWMLKLKNKETTLSIVVPNGSKTIKCSVENNFKVGKEMGFDFFQKIHFGAEGDSPGYTTPLNYMVLKMPVKRAAQLLMKKISIAKDNKSIDSLTGQVTNDSKGSKITNPEIQVLLGMGLKTSLIELIKIRGGDLGASNAMNQMLMNNGVAHQSDVEQFSTGVESTKTLKMYLNGMHIKNTL